MYLREFHIDMMEVRWKLDQCSLQTPSYSATAWKNLCNFQHKEEPFPEYDSRGEDLTIRTVSRFSNLPNRPMGLFLSVDRKDIFGF